MDLNKECEKAVQKDIDIERNYNGLNDPLFDKAFEVVLLAVEALDEAVTRAEEKHCYKICAGIYEGSQHAGFLECKFL